MAINKNKINDNALKLIQKGQIKKAIREYEKILAEDPSDVRTLLKKGDLLVRVGERERAVETYLTVANAYSQQGFHLKAVAVFKQILKIDESRIDVNLRLAEEYQNLGIIGDAMSHLQIVAAYYDQQGLVRESLDILRRIVDLDPENIASRIKLAELYSREDMIQEAVEEFARAAEELKSANRIEDYVKVTERLIFHDPSNVERIKELANIYLQRGDTKRALGKLQICFKSDSRDLEVLGMLALAFQELSQLSKTVSVYKEMAKIYEEQDAVADMQEVYRRILEIAPEDPEANQVLDGAAVVRPAMVEMDAEPSLTETVFAGRVTAAPQPAAAVEMEVQPETEVEIEYQPPTDPASAAPSAMSDQIRELISRLLTETDVYIKYGLHNKAYEHLNRVFAQEPKNIDAHAKLKELYMAAGQHDHAAQELVTLIHLCTQAGRVEDARSFLGSLLTIDPAHPDGPDLEAMLNQRAPVARIALESVEAYPAAAVEIPEVSVTDSDGTQELAAEDALASVDVSLDFEGSEEISSPTGELIGTADQLTAPEVMIPEQLADVSLLHENFSAAEAEGHEVILDDETQTELAMLEQSREVDLDQLPELEDVDELLVLDSDGLLDAEAELSFDDELAERSEEEISTRVADLSGVRLESLDDAVEEGVQSMDPDLLESFQVDEAAIENSPMNTNVYPSGEPLPDLEMIEEDDLDDLRTVTADASGSQLRREAAQDEAGELLGGSEDAEVILLDDSGGLASSEVAELEAEDEPELIDFDNSEVVFVDDADVEGIPARVDEPPAARVEDAAFAVETLEPLDGDELELASAEASPVAPEARSPGVAPEPELLEAEDDGTDLEDGLEEVEFFIQQNLIDEAADALDALRQKYADHPDVQAQVARLDRLHKGEAPVALVTPDELSDSFDLAAEIEREVGDDVSSVDEEFQYSVDDVFSEFKKGVAAVVAKEDSATHFDLGIAYKEMGLVDDAINEFTIASHEESRFASAMTMIGLCYVEKGQYSEAINRFKDALHQRGISEQETTGLYYEMGTVYEKLSDTGEALFYLKKVYKRDPKFRDVAAKLRALVKTAGGKKPPGGGAKTSDSSKSSSGKDKISYM